MRIAVEVRVRRTSGKAMLSQLGIDRVLRRDRIPSSNSKHHTTIPLPSYFTKVARISTAVPKSGIMKGIETSFAYQSSNSLLKNTEAYYKLLSSLSLESTI